jgi:hypothetical protein
MNFYFSYTTNANIHFQALKLLNWPVASGIADYFCQKPCLMCMRSSSVSIAKGPTDTMHDFGGFGGLTFLCYQLLARFIAGGGFEFFVPRQAWFKSILFISRFKGSRLWQKSPAADLSRNF